MSTAPITAKSETGERFGRYQLLEPIGHGGMAEVFRAVSRGVEGFQRVFVIKRILKEKAASREFIEMFVNEARISALLNHPNIVQIYDFGQINGSYFITMEHLRGKDLLTVLRALHSTHKLLPPSVAAYVAQQVAAGLHYAHSLTQAGGKRIDIVHRDVSPSNVMLLREGGVKLLDFGIAKAISGIRKSATTQIGMLKGKLSYLSPEQVKGRPIDGRSDVFALGVVLWECLTGKRLFFDKTDFQTMRNVMERPIPPPSTQRADLPAALDYIVIRALERDLDRRYPDAKMMFEELENFLREIHFSPAEVPRLLDELFGPDTLGAEAHVGGAGSSAEHRRSGESTQALPHESAERGPSPSTSVPPVAPLPVAAAARAGGGSWKKAIFIGGALAVMALAAVSVAVKRDALVAGEARERERARAAAQIPVVERPAPAVIPATPVPAAPTTVSVHVDSDPTGATITGGDGAVLGVTPATITLPRGEMRVPLTITKAGFVSSTQSIVPDRDTNALLTLRAADPPAKKFRRAITQSPAPAPSEAKPTEIPSSETPAPAAPPPAADQDPDNQ